jgi:hypothetical protein
MKYEWSVMVRYEDGNEVRGTDTPTYPTRAKALAAATKVRDSYRWMYRSTLPLVPAERVLIYAVSPGDGLVLVDFNAPLKAYPNTVLKI